jgi:predicted component of type VI protein secretion system
MNKHLKSQNHLPTNFDFEFGSNGVIPIVMELKAASPFCFVPVTVSNSFQNATNPMDAGENANLFRLRTTLHYLEYNRIPHYHQLSPVEMCKCNC